MEEDHIHSPDCGCPPMIYVYAWEMEQIEKNGWFSHYVPMPDTHTINAHTHGFEDLHGHPDVQIVCPVPMEVASQIFWNIHHLLEAGVKLEEGQLYSNIIENMAVCVVPKEECGRRVMRLIMPDKHGELERHKIQPPFDLQYALS